MTPEDLNMLRLAQLADSALPIGATSHSFGLETLASEGQLKVEQLERFLMDYLAESGAIEAQACHEAYRLGLRGAQPDFAERWQALNARLSALRPARESRAASAMLGRRFLRLVQTLEDAPLLREASATCASPHHSAAFGLAGGVLGLDEEHVVTAFLQQSVAGLISAGQRLLPLGQSQASAILWRIKPALLAAAAQGRGCDRAGDEGCCFMPLADIAAMQHPTLTTRLFMS